MLKCYWLVQAGMILGEKDIKHTRLFEITGQEWDSTDNRPLLLLTRAHAAMAYATQLQLASASGLEPNWVNIEYVWR